jgi:hypothetical protein
MRCRWLHLTIMLHCKSLAARCAAHTQHHSQGEEEEGLHGVFKRLRRNGHQLKKEGLLKVQPQHTAQPHDVLTSLSTLL